MLFTSSINRGRRYLFLILFSPFLLPLLCAVGPIICCLEICFRIRRLRRRRRRKTAEVYRGDRGTKVGLLHSINLLVDDVVVGPVYNCGDEGENEKEVEEDGVDFEYFENNGPLFQYEMS
ncbi:unnamed protein product [Fraxinus pennsylvanica]|uniref:Transmembrane protein n=1 Tax=Fraxinus pennsylvanica TaxID=56036 RepID=A0AAD2DJE1_9LAMI|nr:unnamed protein product [Fraxinus pennsylvanica]